jgi:predicted transcriptional regulator
MSKSKKQSSNWKEQRRVHAIELKSQGWKQAEIAIALKVTKGAVSQWITKANLQGEEALSSRSK